MKFNSKDEEEKWSSSYEIKIKQWKDKDSILSQDFKFEFFRKSKLSASMFEEK